MVRLFLDALSGRPLSDEETHDLLSAFAMLLRFFAVATLAWAALEPDRTTMLHALLGCLVYLALAWKLPATSSRVLASWVVIQSSVAMYQVMFGGLSLAPTRIVLLTLWNAVEVVAGLAATRATIAYHRRQGTVVRWSSLVMPVLVIGLQGVAVLVLVAFVLPASGVDTSVWGGTLLEGVVLLSVIVRLVPGIEIVTADHSRGGAPADARVSGRPRGEHAATMVEARRPRPALAPTGLSRTRSSSGARGPTSPVDRGTVAPSARPLARPALVATAPAQPATAFAPATPAAPDPWLGRVIGGRLEIELLAGRGGAGAVYRARHVELGMPVAVKIVPKRHDLQSERFLREARLAASIPSERVLHVFDCGEEETALYLIMEWVEGGTLADRLVAGTLPIGEACQVLEEILEALAAAHELGIVHRDVKPPNVMMSDRGALLADFGIARDAQAATLTREGTMLGTPAYVSPEQVLGEPVDARSDLYSAGVLLFEALTGRLPFTASNPLALMMARLDEEPEPLQRSLPDAPAALVAVVTRAMARDRAQRFRSAREMRAAVAAVRAAL